MKKLNIKTGDCCFNCLLHNVAYLAAFNGILAAQTSNQAGTMLGVISGSIMIDINLIVWYSGIKFTLN